MTLKENLKQAAHDLGFDFASFAPCEPPPYADRLDSWLDEGGAGAMKWFDKHRERRKDPRLLWPEGRSLLTVGLFYHHRVPAELISDPSRGRISKYAHGLDYHRLILHKLKKLGENASAMADRNVDFRAYVDSGPLLEKPIAMSAGSGFIGKNTLLIHRKMGSYVFLGELLLDIELEPDSPPGTSPDCRECNLCRNECPTDALAFPFRLTTTRCISYHTNMNNGPIPRELRLLLGNRIFGCDDCQECCPFNPPDQPATREKRLLPTSEEEAAPRLIEMIGMDDDAFHERFKGSAVERVKRQGLLRSVAVALGNWGSREAEGPLAGALEDHEPLIRGHAAWALGRIGGRAARQALERALKREASPEVRSEIISALEEV